MKRDIPRYETRAHRPSDPANWFKAYRKLKKESDAELAAGEDRLRAAFANINKEKEQNLAKLTTHAVPPPRRAASGWSAKNWAPSAKNLTPSERIKRGQADAQRARLLRERNQIKLGRAMKGSATPQNFTKVTVAPRSMIEDVKKANAPPPPAPRIVRVPVSRRPEAKPPMHGPANSNRPRPKEAGAGYDMIGDREARLKAMQTKKYDATPQPGAQSPGKPKDGGLSLDFLEDDDLFSDDDIAGSPPRHATPQKKGTQTLAPPTATAANARSRSARSVSPRPLPAKRKAPPNIFMAKRPRAGA